MREGKEGAGSCQGAARQGVFVAFSYTKLTLLMEWGGCRYNNPESRPQWLWAWRVLAVSGTLTRFSFTFRLLWTGGLAWDTDDPSSVQHPCWGRTGGWASCPNLFKALKRSWVLLCPAKLDAGCPVCHFSCRRWLRLQLAEELSGQCSPPQTVGKKETLASQVNRTLVSS